MIERADQESCAQRIAVEELISIWESDFLHYRSEYTANDNENY